MKNYMLHLKDGHGYSPMYGSYFTKKGNFVYWDNGEVTDLNNGGVFTSMEMLDGEDYSAWSDEKRAEVLLETKRRREEYLESEKQRKLAMQKLVESARGKLSEGEFDAVVRWAQEEG